MTERTSRRKAKSLKGQIRAAALFGRVIAGLRHEQSWSQKRLADAAGMSQPAVARLEKGVSSPGLEQILRIEKALRGLQLRNGDLFACFSSSANALVRRGYRVRIGLPLEGVPDVPPDVVEDVVGDQVDSLLHARDPDRGEDDLDDWDDEGEDDDF